MKLVFVKWPSFLHHSHYNNVANNWSRCFDPCLWVNKWHENSWCSRSEFLCLQITCQKCFPSCLNESGGFTASILSLNKCQLNCRYQFQTAMVAITRWDINWSFCKVWCTLNFPTCACNIFRGDEDGDEINLKTQCVENTFWNRTKKCYFLFNNHLPSFAWKRLKWKLSWRLIFYSSPDLLLHHQIFY